MKHTIGFGGYDPRNMPDYLFPEAYDLDYANAVRADVEKQNCSVCPRHWYIDATIDCVDCGESFRFTKEEQKHWYEELRFWIDSFPKRCKRCNQAHKLVHQEVDYICLHRDDESKSEKIEAMLKRVREVYGFPIRSHF